MKQLNEIKVLMEMLSKHSFPDKAFSEIKWHTDYKEDLEQQYQKNLVQLHQDIDLLDKTLKNKDLIAVKYALLCVMRSSQNLNYLFSDLLKDFKKIMGWGDGRRLRK